MSGGTACPRCAETVPSAAIVCRHCGADLTTEPAEGLGSERRIPDSAATNPELARYEPGTRRSGEGTVAVAVAGAVRGLVAGRGLTRLLVAAVVLALAALVLVVVLAQRPHQAGGVVTSTAAQDIGMRRARTITQRALSYRAASFDADRRRALRLMTPPMGRQYARTLRRVEARVRRTGLDLTATVTASSVITAGEDEVRALVFVDQTITVRGSRHRQYDANRLVVTLRRDADGRWLMSKLTAF